MTRRVDATVTEEKGPFLSNPLATAPHLIFRA
jgi:hypothetical protein